MVEDLNYAVYDDDNDGGPLMEGVKRVGARGIVDGRKVEGSIIVSEELFSRVASLKEYVENFLRSLLSR